MAGGTWDSQNKVRAGVYIRFKSASYAGLAFGNRGVVAICEPLSWGPVATVQSIEAGDNVVNITGYDVSDTHNRFLQEIFKGKAPDRVSAARKVLVYRPTATGSASATATIGNLTATALYPGVRGNDISLIITAIVGSDNFTVSTLVDSLEVDSQVADTVEALEDNAWVQFSGSGALSANTGTSLSGGADGEVAAAAYSSFLTAIEPYKFDILCYDGSDQTVLAAFISFIERINDENGQRSQLVCSASVGPDSRYIINVQSGVRLSDGTVLTSQQVCWWVSGVEAGARYNESLTYAKYPDAVAVVNELTNSQIISAINAGQFVLFSDEGVVKVETDINSLVTYTSDIGRVYRKNRVMRVCNSIANDIYESFSENFIGVVNNNEIGRSRFKSVIVGYLLEVQANQGIQNFTADDVEVLPGADIDSVIVNLAISVVDSVEKIYMTIEVS